MNLLISTVRPFRFLYEFLELSALRLLVLFIAWIAVGFLLYSNGGIILIAGDVHDALYYAFASTLGFIVSLLNMLFFGALAWLYFSSKSDNDTMGNALYSHIPGNIYHKSEE